jgi:hypothetical protein
MAAAPKRRNGIFKKKNNAAEPDPDAKVVDFTYQNDSLAQMIVEAWTNPIFKNFLLQKQADGSSPNAQTALAQRGIYLSHPVVIEEDTYDDGYDMKHDDEVVFVLPRFSRAQNLPSPLLLETAKLLMAYTPHGI